MFLIRFAIRNPLITNLILVFIILVGVMSWRQMPQEIFPVVDLDLVLVTTIYEGAPPEEVERQVTLPIEDAFDGLPDIDFIQSSSREGNSSVVVKLKPGSDVDDFIREAQNALDGITEFPLEVEKPELSRLKTRFPVINMALHGDVARAYLVDKAEEVKRQLQAIDGVAAVGVAGQQEWEIWVIVDPWVLAARGVSLLQMTQALRDNLRDLPGGTVQSVEGDIVLRGKGYTPQPDDIARVVLRSTAQGGQLTIGDVARVERRLEEAKTLGRYNQRPSVNLTVSKSADASTIVVAEKVRALAAELRQQLPAGVKADVFSDNSSYVKNRLNTVKSSGLIGLLLVLLSLYLFLNFRVALITALGIPVSFLVAVVALHYFGYTINMVSLFAFLIALGMIVDDAIIVNENVYRHMEMGMPAKQAAEVGAREVMWPVIVSTFTTVAAFLPMFAMGGIMGLFVEVIPVVVTAALLGSLFEAFGVLPSHAREFLRVSPPKRRARVDWTGLLTRYTTVLRRALNHRYVVTAITVGILAITLAYAKTRMQFNLFGNVETGQFFINVEAPNTYSLQDSHELAKRIEQNVVDSIQKHELDTMLTNVGFAMVDANRFRQGNQYIQLLIDLERPAAEGLIEKFVSPLVSLDFSWEGERTRSTDTIINDIRERLQRLPGIVRLSIMRPQAGPPGADIEIGILGKDIRSLRQHADTLRDFLQGLDGVYDVQHDMEPGKLEYQYTLNERGRELGLTQAQISDAVRTGFLGLETLFVSGEEKRFPIRLIYTDAVRQNSDLARLPITLADGRVVYLGEVATIEVGRALDTIRRRDQQRLATITAAVDDRVTTPLQVTGQVEQRFSDFSKTNPGYQLLFLGERKAAGDSFKDMKIASVIALATIFFLLAALFKSLLDPVVVMLAIPFGIIGVIIGHVIFDYNLQFLSIIGLLALSGIVVNDSLILIDFAKGRRMEGMERIDAMVEAGRVRIRPILLTSITTFLGVSPLIFFATGQTAFLSPMAVSLGFGLLFATVLILIVLPCLYLIVDDVRTLVCNRLRTWLGKPVREQEAAPYCRLRDDEL